jgi:hypothetical protein
MPKSRGRKPDKRSKKAYRSPAGRTPTAGTTRADNAEYAETVDDEAERRAFAMPYVDARIGDEDFRDLNPDSEDDRSLLIEGEHPEYQVDPEFEGEIDGVDPRLHLAMHQIVTNQLWHNDPPEVWQAARRLRDLGMGRHDILHAIGELNVTHLHAALTTHELFDLERYRAELDQLGRDEFTG